MKIFITLSLFYTSFAFAQTAFFSGATVRIDAVGSQDGLFATVENFNGFNAKITVERITFDSTTQLSRVVSERMIVPADRIRALNENDFCFDAGSIARVSNPYMLNANVIGKVIACDGRQVIFEYPSDAHTMKQQLLQLGDLTPTSADFLQPGDLVTFVAKGFTWTGLPGRVTFSNGQFAWVDYQDKNFESANTKVLVDDLVIDSRIPRPEFSLASLGQGFEVLANLSHGSRKPFFHEIAVTLDRFLPNPTKVIATDSIRAQARHYAMLAVRPVIEAGTSQIYTQSVIPSYLLTVDQYGVKSLSEFAQTNESSMSAAIVLGAVLQAVSTETVSDLERKLVKEQLMKTGLWIATSGKPSSTLNFLAQSVVMKPVLARWLANPVLKSYAIVYQSVLNDLEAKLK